MTVDDWRARYGHLSAETDRLRAERAASNAQLASVLHDIHRVEAERDAALAEVDRLQADIMNVHLKRAMLVVQRDAAQAGAEALERLEAMESTGSAMLPKSTSASEEGQ